MSRHPHAAAAAAAATPPPAVGTPRTWTRWTWGRQQSVARILAGTMPVVTLLIATVADPTAYSSTRSQPMIHANNSPRVA